VLCIVGQVIAELHFTSQRRLAAILNDHFWQSCNLLLFISMGFFNQKEMTNYFSEVNAVIKRMLI
jgi:hypothetical protein